MIDELLRLLPALGIAAAGHFETAVGHNLFEQVALLSLADGVQVRS